MSSDSPASILFDELGNPVGVIFDGTIYRLQTQTTIVDGYGNGPAAVTPPFTGATSADPALVVAISPNNSFTINFQKPTTSTNSSVPASTSSQLLLSSNGLRLGATIYNDSNGLLYIRMGTPASTSSFAIKLFPMCYWEVPFGYLGEIDGIWTIASGSLTGNARIDELTP